MPSGALIVDLPVDAVRKKLRTLLAAANCEVTPLPDGAIFFRHGTYLTHTASMFPKEAVVRFTPREGATRINYEISCTPFVKAIQLTLAVLLFFLVFPPIIAHFVLVKYPEKFIKNLLAGI